MLPYPENANSIPSYQNAGRPKINRKKTKYDETKTYLYSLIDVIHPIFAAELMRRGKLSIYITEDVDSKVENLCGVRATQLNSVVTIVNELYSNRRDTIVLVGTKRDQLNAAKALNRAGFTNVKGAEGGLKAFRLSVRQYDALCAFA